MDRHRIDELTRALSGVPSRRHLVGGLVGVLGLSAPRFSCLTEAKKKHKRKKKVKKPKPNAFGCLEVGDACKNADQCCSGICEGKRCRAHGTGTCDQQYEGHCATTNPAASVCNNSQSCGCFRTTAGSNFCAAFYVGGGCTECQTDADCTAQGFPDGSACVPFSTGLCGGACESGMA